LSFDSTPGSCRPRRQAACGANRETKLRGIAAVAGARIRARQGERRRRDDGPRRRRRAKTQAMSPVSSGQQQAARRVEFSIMQTSLFGKPLRQSRRSSAGREGQAFLALVSYSWRSETAECNHTLRWRYGTRAHPPGRKRANGQDVTTIPEQFGRDAGTTIGRTARANWRAVLPHRRRCSRFGEGRSPGSGKASDLGHDQAAEAS